ncbi:hypothetical protein [Bordetella sp. LUAb4]|uniref:hypothetical protein n=1 Tax=Bordetella sp. LUAb4 TaxID=2843195 RepID=UPI001E562ABD|nr:hypothetical protein [Bordetella sp. LUAb4]
MAQAVGVGAAGVAAGVSRAKSAKYEPNRNAVGNMAEFLRQPGFGNDVKNKATKTSQQFQGQSIYKANHSIGGGIRKGDLFYLDGIHKDHIEVFYNNGYFKAVLDLDGTFNEAKTKSAKGRTLK